MGFWRNVDEEVKFKNLSRKELAFKSGIPQTTIDKGIERDSEVSAVAGLKIAKALGRSLESLLELDETAATSTFAHSASRSKKTRYASYSSLFENMEKLPDTTKERIQELVADLAARFGVMP